jgi:hypothetical protein
VRSLKELKDLRADNQKKEAKLLQLEDAHNKLSENTNNT